MLVKTLEDDKVPSIIGVAKFDETVPYETMSNCIVLYGSEPLAGYQQGSLQGNDDPSLPSIRTRPHRFAVKCRKMAQHLMELGDADPGESPLYGLQLIPLILETKCKWKPYQCQVVYKRFLEAKHPFLLKFSNARWQFMQESHARSVKPLSESTMGLNTLT